MQSPEYLERLDHILSARVEEEKERNKPRGHRVAAGVGVLGGTLAMFFVLKAAALAASGAPLVETGAEASLTGQIYRWFAGADPVTRTLAAAMRGPDASTL